MIKSGKLLGDDTKKTELPENLNWAGESGMSGMSQNAKISGLKNVEGIVGHTDQFGVGQGASPRKQGGQKPWEIDIIGKGSGVVKNHQAQKKPSDKWKKSAKEISSKKLTDKFLLGDKHLKTKYPILKCYNRFSVLEIDDVDDKDANEDVYDKTKAINKVKKNKKKRKNNKKFKNKKNKKKASNSKAFQQTKELVWNMDGKCLKVTKIN